MPEWEGIILHCSATKDTSSKSWDAINLTEINDSEEVEKIEE